MTIKAPAKPRVKREKSTSTKGHYVTNAVLLPAVLEAKELNKVTDKLIRMIWMIAERYSRKGNFVGYSFREDMVSAAVMNLCNNALKFNPEKSSNPFSFYTTAIHNSFLQFLGEEKNHRNLRDALLIDAGSNPSFNFMQGEKDEVHFEVKESDEIHVHEDNLLEEGEEPTVQTSEEEDEVVKPQVKELKVHQIPRQPGTVKRYGPGDFKVDENGNIVIIREPDQSKYVSTRAPAPEPVKRNPWGRKKAAEPTPEVPAVEAVPEKVKKPAVKKVATKKATKTVEKEVKPAKKTAAKKVK